jgi:hypothetical protein
LAIFAELARRGDELSVWSSAGHREASEGWHGELLPEVLESLRADPPDYLILDAAASWGRVAAGTSHGGRGPASATGNAGKIEKQLRARRFANRIFRQQGRSVGSPGQTFEHRLGMRGRAGRNETSGYYPLA